MPHLPIATVIIIIVAVVAIGYALYLSAGELFGWIGMVFGVIYLIALAIRKARPGRCPSCRQSALTWTSWENVGNQRRAMSMFRGWNHFECRNCGKHWKSRVIGMLPADDRAFSIHSAD